MIPWLQRAGRVFRIFVIEQNQDGLVFNKGALFNIGYKIAKAEGFDYLALHDVDQIPEHPANRYEFTEFPVHLCSQSSQFGYRMAYPEMVGGALKMSMRAYELAYGFSNSYWGWGQEDDDVFYRIQIAGYAPIQRLGPPFGRFRALDHPRVHGLDVTSAFRRGQQHLNELRNLAAVHSSTEMRGVTRDPSDPVHKALSADGCFSVKYALRKMAPLTALTPWATSALAMRYTVDLQLDELVKTLD
jgi:hypothetical protein